MRTSTGLQRGLRRERAATSVILLAAFLLALPLCLGDEIRLYPAGGISPGAVRQGAIGSCYFHASIAAIAQSHPETLRKMISENPDHSFTVVFPDGKKEIAYPQDLNFARQSGYENSEGLWVVILFRAYAQRVLRETLINLIDQSGLLPVLKPATKEFLSSYDFALLAYDRAIRNLVDQRGRIDRARLVARLKEEMRPFGKYEQFIEPLIGLLDSGGTFELLVETIRKNGELFGAYRAVGQGGLPDRVLEAFLGKPAQHFETKENAQVLSVFTRLPKHPVVATTVDTFADLVAAGRLGAADQSWYLKTHAFTVIAYDAPGAQVILRNPWATHPGPDGMFTLPMTKLQAAFPTIVTIFSESADK